MDNVFKKVLYVGPINEFGGIGAVLDMYSKYIKDFTYLSTYPTKSFGSLRFVTQLYNIVYFIGSIFRLIWILIINKNIEIIHLHTALKGSFVRKSIIALIGKMFRKKIVFHIHSGGFRKFYIETKIFKPVIRKILQKWDAVICLSSQWQEFYIKELHLQNTKVIGNPIEHSAMVNVNRKFNYPLQLLFLGKVCDEKGIFDLIHYLNNNRHFINNRIKLIIAGNGEIDRLKMTLKKLDNDTKIEFIGWVSGTAKNKVLSECDIYILPSYFEGLPVSILEAMSFGKPIISTNVGGVPSIVSHQDNGWLFEPGAFECLDRIFDDILECPDILNNYGNNSLKTVHRYYPQVIFKELAALYHSILEN
jgi:glycosyltransferase involved in cell wall biosynthesis